jgi:hypothetical protein
MAQNAGISPRGLVMQDEAYLLHTDPRIASTFPSGSERMRMFDALNKLFEDIRHAAIFPGQRGAKSTDKGMSDPSTWGKLNPKHDDTSSDIVTALQARLRERPQPQSPLQAALLLRPDPA